MNAFRRLIFIFSGLLFTSAEGLCQDSKMLPLGIVTQNLRVPAHLVTYQPALVTLLNCFKNVRPPDNNTLGLVAQLTMQRFMDDVGMPLLGTQEITIYEISLQSFQRNGDPVICLVLRFVPGNHANQNFFNAAQNNVLRGIDLLKQTVDKTELEKWAKGLLASDSFKSIAPCGVAVFTLTGKENNEWTLAAGDVQKKFRYLRRIISE